jgi:hypothetical protein
MATLTPAQTATALKFLDRVVPRGVEEARELVELWDALKADQRETR